MPQPRPINRARRLTPRGRGDRRAGASPSTEVPGTRDTAARRRPFSDRPRPGQEAPEARRDRRAEFREDVLATPRVRHYPGRGRDPLRRVRSPFPFDLLADSRTVPAVELVVGLATVASPDQHMPSVSGLKVVANRPEVDPVVTRLVDSPSRCVLPARLDPDPEENRSAGTAHQRGIARRPAHRVRGELVVVRPTARAAGFLWYGAPVSQRRSGCRTPRESRH